MNPIQVLIFLLYLFLLPSLSLAATPMEFSLFTKGIRLANQVSPTEDDGNGLQSGSSVSDIYLSFEVDFGSAQRLIFFPSFALNDLIIQKSSNNLYERNKLLCSAAFSCSQNENNTFNSSIKGQGLEITPGNLTFWIPTEIDNFKFRNSSVMLSNSTIANRFNASLFGMSLRNNKIFEENGFQCQKVYLFLNIINQGNFDYSLASCNQISQKVIKNESEWKYFPIKEKKLERRRETTQDLGDPVGNMTGSYIQVAEILIGSNQFNQSNSTSSLLTLTMSTKNICVPSSIYSEFLIALSSSSKKDSIVFKIIDSNSSSGFFELEIDSAHFRDHSNMSQLLVKDSALCIDVDSESWGLGLVPASKFIWSFDTQEVGITPSVLFERSMDFRPIYGIFGLLSTLAGMAFFYGFIGIFLADEKIEMELVKLDNLSVLSM